MFQKLLYSQSTEAGSVTKLTERQTKMDRPMTQGEMVSVKMLFLIIKSNIIPNNEFQFQFSLLLFFTSFCGYDEDEQIGLKHDFPT